MTNTCGEVVKVLAEEWDMDEETIKAVSSKVESVNRRLTELSNGEDVNLRALHAEVKAAVLGDSA